MRWRVGERKETGDTGLKPARQRDRLVTETLKGRARNRKRRVAA